MTQTPTSASTPAPARPAPEEQDRRDRRSVRALVVMTALVLLFTAVSIVFEIVNNRHTSFRAEVVIGQRLRNDAYRVTFRVVNTGKRPGRPDKCEAVLTDIRGERAGAAGISLRAPIQPGQTYTEDAVGTVAREPVGGTASCRALEPQ